MATTAFVQVQQELAATYRLLADRPGSAELRRRLQWLTVEAFYHPCWAGRRPTAPLLPPRRVHDRA
ncbi:hypothetical protein PUR57_00725 [Streptomyces sp. JV176]|uniref:hypothetical protein n=1 Tax=Streptomyces sp. JV176 TaxID=858630 RepID=UPI002E7853C5|nr:hypothetical protein [Streptomyces sp. JV176]MEE1797233.1 hypothetical protein [Streptomyces sp. JV176]